jgi:hypothetical protein
MEIEHKGLSPIKRTLQAEEPVKTTQQHTVGTPERSTQQRRLCVSAQWEPLENVKLNVTCCRVEAVEGKHLGRGNGCRSGETRPLGLGWGSTWPRCDPVGVERTQPRGKEARPAFEPQCDSF